jgi:tetratricopeptide (TPR) repeat protein
MRLILAALFVAVAGGIGWFAGSYLGLVGDGRTADDVVATGSTLPEVAIAESAAPVSIVVPADGSALAAPSAPIVTAQLDDAPIDLTEPRASGADGSAGTGGAAGRPRPVINPADPEVDESALRYFARTGDQRRLDAEMSRLKLLYPDWIPPANPAAPEVYVDPELERMWQLFAEEEYAEVRAAIAERRAREPDWEAPVALIELLDEADSRVRLVNASNAKQWNTVIDTAAAEPSLLTCAYVDVLWRVAEAFANTDRVPRAKDTYAYILTNCDNPQERVATLEKAMDVLPADALPALLAFERGDEFATVNDLLLRRRVSVTSQNPELVSPPEDLERLAVLAEAGDAEDALLLGWYFYRHKEPRRALDWFDKARQRDPNSTKAVEGYTLSLIDLGRFGDAEAASFDWRDKSEDNLAAYLIAAVGLLATDPPARIAEPVLQRMAEVIVREKSLQGAEQMGWYAYNLGQIRTASRWFETVLRWDPAYEPGAYGLAVVRWAMKDVATVNAIKRDWAASSQRIADIGRPGQAGLRGSQPIDVIVDAPSGTARPSYRDRPVWVPLSDAPRSVERQVVVEDVAPALPYVEPAYADRSYAEAPTVAPAPTEQPYVSRTTVEQPYSEQPYVDQPYVQQPPARGYVEAPVAMVEAPVASGGGGSRRGDCGTMSTPTRSLSPSAALSRGWCLMDLNRPVEGGCRVRRRARLEQRQDPLGRRLWRLACESPLRRDRQGVGRLRLRADDAEAADRAQPHHSQPAGLGGLYRRALHRGDPRPRRAGPAGARAERPDGAARLVLLQARPARRGEAHLRGRCPDRLPRGAVGPRGGLRNADPPPQVGVGPTPSRWVSR